MTIERIKGLQVAMCDGDRCTETLESMTWLGIQEAIRDEEWRSELKHGDWFHYCPECQKEIAENIRKGMDKL
jgi:hypothetical protein